MMGVDLSTEIGKAPYDQACSTSTTASSTPTSTPTSTVSSFTPTTFSTTYSSRTTFSTTTTTASFHLVAAPTAITRAFVRYLPPPAGAARPALLALRRLALLLWRHLWQRHRRAQRLLAGAREGSNSGH